MEYLNPWGNKIGMLYDPGPGTVSLSWGSLFALPITVVGFRKINFMGEYNWGPGVNSGSSLGSFNFCVWVKLYAGLVEYFI